MSDDEAYEQLTQDMQAMCRDLSAHAETIPHTQESIDALRELVDRVLEANPDSDLGQYKAYPSWLAIVQAGHGLTRTLDRVLAGTPTVTTTCASTGTATGRA